MDYATFDAKNKELLTLNLQVVELMALSADVSKECAAWLGTAKALINAEVNADDKPIFSNDSKRDAELLCRQALSVEWQNLDKRMSEVAHELAVTRAEIEYAKYDVRWFISANNV